MPELREYTATKRDNAREYRATLRRRILESFFGVSITGTNSPVTEGDTLDVDTKVEETDGLSDTQDVTLDVPSGTQVDVQSVSLNANGTATITLSWSTQSGDAGDYTAEVASEDDTATASITVDPAALIWDAADLDAGTDTGVVHEDTANTDYNSDSVVRKGDPTESPIAASDLLRWYPLQDDAGPSKDFGGGGYGATVNGATPAGGTALTGLSTYLFDGTDDYLQSAYDNSLDLVEFTIMGWVRSTNNSQRMGVLGNFTPPNGWYLGNFDGDSDGDYEPIVYNNSNGNADWIYAPDDLINDGNWHHLVGRRSGSGAANLDLFVDGQPVPTNTGSDAGSSAQQGTEALNIGDRGNESWLWDGSISDVRVYNAALADATIQQIYDVFGAPSDHETVYKGPSPSPSPTASFTSVSIPSGASATLEFLEDTNGDGTVDNTDSVAMSDATTDYTASGLAGSGDLALRVTFENTDLTVGSTVEVPVEVTA